MISTFEPKALSIGEVQGLMQGLVCPRPIAFASTIDRQGQVNLSPFSFFNLFSINPPILVFSPSRRGRDGSVKHTLENVLEVPEVVINVVNYGIVEQASLSSVEYEKGVNEFVKAGLTAVPSLMVKPPRVGESPAAFECQVNQVIPLGTGGGAGNLVIAEVLLIHVKAELLDESGKKVIPQRLDAVARMGGDWYSRANASALFEVPKPNQKKGIGVDQLPQHIRLSKVLTGNNLGRLGNVEQLPDGQSVEAFAESPLMQAFRSEEVQDQDALHRLAASLLEEGKITEAWLLLMQDRTA
jgi:flavin reductase (DIM6/NTAB) family NADH-FMN oxidoreductase RutF